MHHYDPTLRQQAPLALPSPAAMRRLTGTLLAAAGLAAGALLLGAVPLPMLGWVLAAATAGLMFLGAVERCGGGHERSGQQSVRQVVRDGGSLGAKPVRKPGGAVLRCLDGGSLERARY